MLSAQDSDSDILWYDREEQDTDVSAQELAGINSSGDMVGPRGRSGEPGPTSDSPDEAWKSDGETDTEHGMNHASADGAMLASNSTEGHEHRQVSWNC